MGNLRAILIFPISVAATVAATLAGAPNAQAWSGEGHRITGHIATALLNDAARRQLQQLLGNDDLAEIASVMDDEREQFERAHPGSSKWHYENREVCDSTAACPRGDCLTRQLEPFIRVLRDPHAQRAQRIEAVTVLVHLIGDLHQPLHLADNRDRGGNDTWVVLPREREPRRLHETWDYSFVRLNSNRRAPATYAHALLREMEPRIAGWQRGSIESWARETHALGKNAYETLPGFRCSAMAGANQDAIRLSASYVQASRQVVAEQLAKAGARIAFTLNEIWRSQ